MTEAEAATYDTWRKTAGESAGTRCYSGFGQRRGRFERYALVPRAVRSKSGKEILDIMHKQMLPDGRVVVIDGAEAVEVRSDEFMAAFDPERLQVALEGADRAHQEDETGRLVTDILQAVEETRTERELAAVRQELGSPLAA
ncbi:MAG: hypothetical protein M3N59_01075 [bacterium]|nr:hypothetical protein [bacterium]